MQVIFAEGSFFCRRETLETIMRNGSKREASIRLCKILNAMYEAMTFVEHEI